MLGCSTRSVALMLQALPASYRKQADSSPGAASTREGAWLKETCSEHLHAYWLSMACAAGKTGSPWRTLRPLKL